MQRIADNITTVSRDFSTCSILSSILIQVFLLGMTIAKRSENEKKKGSVLCTKAFHQVNSQPISRLFAVVDYALQDLRCGGETEIYIVTDYCSGLRNFKYYDRNIEVSIVEEFDDNLTELYFYVILAVSNLHHYKNNVSLPVTFRLFSL